ncbi:MAG: flagellar hook assembly protein FlgD [Opitutae bacterium]|nr:flagellar hook assembly protein FlgD [Opitutae bacterium]
MSVSAITSASAATSVPPPKIAAGPKVLNSDDFMKLLAVQFRSQDPMKPMEDTAFIAQMAQFSSLSQTQTMTAELARLSANQALATANSYLGRVVTVGDGKGGSASGTVAGVEIGRNGPRLVVGGLAYDISAVLSVQPGTLPPPLPAPASAGGS